MLAVQVGTITFQGEVSRYDSSEWAERGFCSRCGSNLFYRLKEADQYIVCTGAFDDESEFELVGEPTTSMMSQRSTSDFTASWRFWVA